MAKTVTNTLLISLLYFLISCGSDELSNITSLGEQDSPLTSLLRFDSLTNLTSKNEENYPVDGTCDSRLKQVIIIIGQPNAITILDCTDDNRFFGTLDVRNVSSNPPTITATQGQRTVRALPVENQIKRFVTQWRFKSNDYNFTFPIKKNLNYDFIIDWGDGTPQSEVTSFEDEDKHHVYTNSGKYTITVIGLCEGFENSSAENFSGGPHSENLIKVLNLGNMGWKDLSFAFLLNYNLTEVLGGHTPALTDMRFMFTSAIKVEPSTRGWNTSRVTNMSHVFDNAYKANPDTSLWNTSQVTDMSSMFKFSKEATPYTSHWDTSKVTDMSRMFSFSEKANPDTSRWNTSQVTNMESMFSRMPQGNPDTSNWDTSQVINMADMFAHMNVNAKPDTSQWNTSQVKYMGTMFAGIHHTPEVRNWDTSQVVTMNYMFYLGTSNPDIGLWNTSQVKNMSYMFATSPNANPDMSLWNFESITNMNNIFNGQTGLSSDNYSKFLKVAAETIPELILGNKAIGGLTPIKTQYNPEVASFRETLINRGWSINDGGPTSASAAQPIKLESSLLQ